MKIELNNKFIQHINLKQSNEGFTLVELLVVITIIGILAAIALPNFLNQGAKAKQTEARQNIGLINRSQTLYRGENSTFANIFDNLGIGSLSGNTGNTSTANYSYSLTGAINNSTIIATAQDTALKAYSGGNNRYTNSASVSVIGSIVCQALTPGTTSASLPLVGSTSSGPTCPASGYQQLGN